jgi:macrolide-specific efflux system membrane fusion protein
VARILAKEGDVVATGAELAVIENEEARFAVNKAERELDVAGVKAENDVRIRFARKAHEVAEAEYRRALESIEKFHKSVSSTELDQLRLSAEKAQLEIEQAEQDQAVARLTMRQMQCELDAARLRFERHSLVAPFDGMVVEIRKQRQEWVDPGDTVLRLVRLDRLRAEAFVPAKTAASLNQGQTVALKTALADGAAKSREGRIVFISPEINPVNGQVRLWAEIDNRDLSLRPGQKASLVLEALPGPETLQRE